MISKEETIKRLEEARFTVQPYLYMNEAFDVAIEALSQPERPKGRWIEECFESIIPVEYDDSDEPILHRYTCYRCNQCGRTEKKKEPYCHCGADMRGVEE